VAVAESTMTDCLCSTTITAWKKQSKKPRSWRTG